MSRLLFASNSKGQQRREIEMAFRSDESAETGFNRALRFLARHPESGMTKMEIDAAECYLRSLVERVGPVVDEYPVWHPLVNHCSASIQDSMNLKPKNNLGYSGLDHTIYFVHGFITCPYLKISVQELSESIQDLNKNFGLTLTCDMVNVPLYRKGAFPVLVTSNACYQIENDLTIGKKSAIKLFLKNVVNSAEFHFDNVDWKDFSHTLLGSPSGARSSLFVNEATGQALKTLCMTLVKQGFFS